MRQNLLGGDGKQASTSTCVIYSLDRMMVEMHGFCIRIFQIEPHQIPLLDYLQEVPVGDVC